MYYFCADFCTVTALYYKDNEYVLFLLQMPSTEGDEWLNVAEQCEKNGSSATALEPWMENI